MRVFTCVDHANHWVGVASVIVANDEKEAQRLLDAELLTHGLQGYDRSPYTLREIQTGKPQAIVLQDGDY